MSRYTCSNTTVHNIGYHIIWCPKYRRKVLVGDIEERLKILRTRIPTRSYFVESVGHLSQDVVRKYIEEQKNA